MRNHLSESSLVNLTQLHNKVTLNGAVTHGTTLSNCLNMFFQAGATRRWTDSQILNLFEKAFVEDAQTALKILFWARDCRGGAGEKRFFQTICKYIDRKYPELWDMLAGITPEYGYWKDLFKIEAPNDNNLNFLAIQLEENDNANLLAKYFPRKGPWFVAMHKYKGMSPKEFRQYLVSKSNTVEQLICSKQLQKIKYSTVPSVAMNKYRNIFAIKDQDRFLQYLDEVKAGKAKINAKTLFPVDLYQSMHRGDDMESIELQWKALPNYMEGSKERIMPVCDVSGSMSGLPMDVSVSLGLYIAERNESVFKNAFITFSEVPEMNYIKGDSLADKFASIESANWGFNTNLAATFKLILNTAIKHKLPESQMPTKLLIISDMEFDESGGQHTNLELIREKYKDAGYTIPEIIFWNVNGRPGNYPANVTDKKVGLVSGFSPAILTAILQGEVATPEQLMFAAINSDRYDLVSTAIEDYF